MRDATGARRGLLLAAVLAAALLPGCVSRKLFLHSEPAGAEVWLDGRRVGATPYEEALPAWGTRDLELRLPGHAPLRTHLALPAPWYEYWPLDMLAAAWPWTIEAHRSFTFTLQPAVAEAQDWDAAERAYERARGTVLVPEGGR